MNAFPDTCPHSATQNMGGACEACTVKRANADDQPPSTILSRFEVGDPVCGTVDNYPNRVDAIQRARSHQAVHALENDPDPVTVFDRMARIGDTCLWNADGQEIEKRIMTDIEKTTPRPWRVVNGAIMIAAGRHRVRIAADQEAMADAIATRKDIALKRAALIVTAVNAYDAMREALGAADGFINGRRGVLSHSEVARKIAAALAAAEGK